MNPVWLPVQQLADGTAQGRMGEGEAENSGLRAGCGAVALLAFARRTNQIESGDPEEALGDLIGDLLHLADVLGLDGQERLENGHWHYSEEKKEEADYGY